MPWLAAAFALGTALADEPPPPPPLPTLDLPPVQLRTGPDLDRHRRQARSVLFGGAMIAAAGGAVALASLQAQDAWTGDGMRTAGLILVATGALTASAGALGEAAWVNRAGGEVPTTLGSLATTVAALGAGATFTGAALQPDTPGRDALIYGGVGTAVVAGLVGAVGQSSTTYRARRRMVMVAPTFGGMAVVGTF